MTLQQWLDQWKHKSRDVQDRVQVALKSLQKHYGVGRDDKVLSVGAWAPNEAGGAGAEQRDQGAGPPPRSSSLPTY
jgi:hypothetical protein